MNVHFVKTYGLIFGVSFACGIERVHPEWAFMSTYRKENVTCLECKEAME